MGKDAMTMMITKPVSRKKLAFYAVRVGRKPGVYTSWADAAPQVKRFPNAEYRKFGTKAEAEAWFASTDGDQVKTDYVIYVDGSCTGNPGNGGWAVLVINADGKEKLITGGEHNATNNRMEVAAAMHALMNVPRHKTVRVFTGSQYIRSAFANGWIDSWRLSWTTTTGKEVANIDLWQKLAELVDDRTVYWVWQTSKGDASRVERVAMEAKQAAVNLK